MEQFGFCSVRGVRHGPVARFCPGCGECLLDSRAEDALTVGLAALRAGEVDRALPLLEDAAKAGTPVALLAYGTALLRRGRPDEAVSPLTVAAAALPDIGEAHAYLAMARLHTLDIDGAREAMTRAVMVAPESFAVRLKQAELLLRLGYYREALAETELTLRLTAPDSETLAFAERLLMLARKKAPNTYTRPIGRMPHLPIGRWLRRSSRVAGSEPGLIEQRGVIA